MKSIRFDPFVADEEKETAEAFDGARGSKLAVPTSSGTIEVSLGKRAAGAVDNGEKRTALTECDCIGRLGRGCDRLLVPKFVWILCRTLVT